jgi:flagellar biogenesis protein FliO
MPAAFWALYAEKLAIVALLLAGLYFAARSLRATRAFARSRNGLRVVGSVMLTPQAALHVVEVDARRFLIGTGTVRALAELEPPNEAT